MEILMVCSNYVYFFYKQLALGWKIRKQLSGFNLFSLSNNKNYILKKIGVFICNKRKLAVKLTIHQNSAVSKNIIGKNVKSLTTNINLNVDFEAFHSLQT